MNNPLNELSAVYNQSIAEGCGCDKKKKEKEEKSMEEGLAPGDIDQKVGAVTAIPKDEREAAKARLLAKAKAKRAAVKEGHCEEEGVKCSPVEKKKDSKKSVKEHVSWRTDLREIVGNPADAENTEQPSPKKQEDSVKEIKEKNIKNKIKINPPQGVTEGFEKLGGVVVEMYEIEEEETPEEKKKREMRQKTKDHDDKMAGKVAEQMSVKDQMRISQEFNRKSPEEKKAFYKKALSGIKKGTPKKDTRTDAQKMTDATGPRPGSHYRGD